MGPRCRFVEPSLGVGGNAPTCRPGTHSCPDRLESHRSVFLSQAFRGGSASLQTFAQVEPTCFQMGPVV
jgi:hypothetical protein